MTELKRRIRAGQIQRLLPENPPPGTATYAFLADTLRELLMAGRLPMHANLPAERELARELAISRSTVSAAYERLRAAGYAQSRHGSGTLTCVPQSEKVVGQWPQAGHNHIDLSMAAAPATLMLNQAVEAATHALPAYARGAGYHPAGLFSLREAIARAYARRGVPTVAAQIPVTCGAQHALSLLSRELLARGDAVVCETPTYPHAMSCIRREGARLVPVGLDLEHGWDLELFANAARQAAARMFYVIPEFQNPTGHRMDLDGRRELVAITQRLGAQVIVDEIYAGFAFDDLALPPLAAFDRDSRVISVGGLSKLGWGGLRLGWIRSSAALVERLIALRSEIDTATPVFEQLIALTLVDRLDELARERQAFVHHRDALVVALQRDLPTWKFRIPQGGLCLWVELDAAISTSLAVAAAQHEVHLVPGSFFGADGLLERYLRLPYMHAPEVLDQAVQRIARARAHLLDHNSPTKGRYEAVV